MRRARISLRSRTKPGASAEAVTEEAGSARDPAGLVALGEFGRAQGLHGEVRLKSFTEIPEAIMGYSPLRDARGQLYTIVSVRPLEGDMLVARIDGVTTRAAAEALTRRKLFIARDVLTDEALDEDEYHHADLIGLKAVTPDGVELGLVHAVENYGAGDILTIRLLGSGREEMVPFVKSFVPVLDLKAGTVTIDMVFEETPQPRRSDRKRPS